MMAEPLIQTGRARQTGRPRLCCYLGIMGHQDGVANLRRARVIGNQAAAGPAAHYVTWSGNPQADCPAFAKAIVDQIDDPTRRSVRRYGRHRIEGELGWSAQAACNVNAYDRLLRHDAAAAANGVPARAAA
jgi:hypothetical protein